MKYFRVGSISSWAFAILIATAHVASAATVKVVSSRSVLDTRDPSSVIVLNPKLSAKVASKRLLLQYDTPSYSIPRPTSGTKEVYLQLNIPAFRSENKGLGVFYGLAIFGLPVSGETLQYKTGGGIPGPSTPATDWIPTAFNKIVDTRLSAGAHFFKITLKPSTALMPFSFRTNFLVARLMEANGGIASTFDKGKPLWLVCHGKNDWAGSFRSMTATLGEAQTGTQVLVVDWASGAHGWDVDLTNGRYFINLAKNLSGLLQSNGYSPRRVNWTGHSWGTLVGYEVALALGGVNRFVALDPATQAWGGYDDDRVVFENVSMTSTGVKGGGSLSGKYGSEKKAKTTDFAIRLFSLENAGSKVDSGFYHSLPRDWYIRALKGGGNDTFWTYFKSVALRGGERPNTPWTAIFAGGMSGFDLESHGLTSYAVSKETTDVRFLRQLYLLYRPEAKRRQTWEVRRSADLKWSMKRAEE